MSGLNDKTYTYIVNDDTSVTFTANADGVEQNLSGIDLSSPESLTDALDSYRDAYIAGLEVASTQIGEGITVGQTQQGS